MKNMPKINGRNADQPEICFLATQRLCSLDMMKVLSMVQIPARVES